MITDSFDIATETYINEEDFYGKKYLKLEDVMALQISCLLYTREKRLHSISQN